ncbi:hypothetical protein B0A58_01310 [Flavobacterium branchiophilum NBRC 15030 = ATCC 35035]|uniref:PD-(D/E)XK nuclease superfamily protein n=1 Tax=Flavobacterium branchiophilum TaxID=55197 RepID=A0A543G752_9FLAO|nr:hypothetical protein [Flavobacterium branchiophilum]OXA81785.1 hypothetical protein B0A58_01310 [Flavobacterium branchiophilum NBRC 15030 = ATCC 35035]TQM41899.1 hypothetical protein BC670_2913 [Flavobacterium branchiophilum]GEM54339.1 hypothetical protein FB1_05600 [Flavobacterium branchiophilum NBRC 15030 = ATCC 35035]
MNSHLNIFKTYTNSFRTYQLENDLTRAFAITLQEDSMFFNEVLKEIFKNSKFYSQLFESLESETSISIDIQKAASKINDFEHIFAITLSESFIGNFWDKNHNRKYDPICDLVIEINGVYLIIEAKRDSVDCTAQLYNQILNVVSTNENNIFSLNEAEHGKLITPYDLNWSKLMSIAVKVLSFQKSFGNTNRFLNDFVALVKSHNFRWLPESPINALNSSNRNSILRRIDSAIIEVAKNNNEIEKLHYNDRLGIVFTKNWAQEILFNINQDGDLTVAIYPGNTKSQGHSLFSKNPNFNKQVVIFNEAYEVSKTYHIKFTSFQKYFTGLWFGENSMKENLYTRDYFYKYTGRKKRGDDWAELGNLFDNCLDYNWREQCNWQNKIEKSGKNQFDISFGYEVVIKIPFTKLKELDTEQSNLTNLTNLITEINSVFKNNLLNTST